MNPITMENIVDAVLEEGLATRAEIDEILREFYALAADKTHLSPTVYIRPTHLHTKKVRDT